MAEEETAPNVPWKITLAASTSTPPGTIKDLSVFRLRRSTLAVTSFHSDHNSRVFALSAKAVGQVSDGAGSAGMFRFRPFSHFRKHETFDQPRISCSNPPPG